MLTYNFFLKFSDDARGNNLKMSVHLAERRQHLGAVPTVDVVVTANESGIHVSVSKITGAVVLPHMFIHGISLVVTSCLISSQYDLIVSRFRISLFSPSPPLAVSV